MQATEMEFWQLIKPVYILVLIIYIYSRYFFFEIRICLLVSLTNKCIT